MTVYRLVFTETRTELKDKNSFVGQSFNPCVISYPSKPPYLDEKRMGIMARQISGPGLPYVQWELDNEEWIDRTLNLTGEISVQKSEDNGKTWMEFGVESP
jgi:hypothetical protein